MLNFFLADRVKETSRVEGTGSIILDGAVPGFSSFGDFYASGDAVFYAIADNSKYEVGSGVYQMSGQNRVITRSPIRSSNMNSGPWYVSGSTAKPYEVGINGFFYPLWLSRSSALSGVGFSDGPFSDVSGINFVEFPGQTFYYTPNRVALGVGSLAGSGSNFSTAAMPVNFFQGVKEVFVTYPGKTSVYNGYGLSNVREPKSSGVAFWVNEQVINYSPNLVWNDNLGVLGIGVSNPQSSIDARGFVRASGFIENGSGVLFVGGPQISGGRQLEPFLRNQLGNAAQGVIELSGLVSQFIGFAKQNPSTVFAGPISGCASPPCDPDYPSFRFLTMADLPISDINNLIQGYIPGADSGVILQDDHYIFDKNYVPLGASGVILQDYHYIFDDSYIPGAASGVILQDNHYIFDESYIPNATSGVILQDDHYIFDQSYIPGAESGVILQDGHYIFDQSYIPGAESGVFFQDGHYIFDQSYIPEAESGILLQDDHYIFDQSYIPGAESGILFQDNHYIFDSSVLPPALDAPSAASGLKSQDNVYIMDPDGTGNLSVLNFPSSRIIVRGGDFSPSATWSGSFGSVIIGSGAATNLLSSADDFLVAIGHNALSSDPSEYSVGIGYEAGSLHTGTNVGQSVYIGQYAGHRNNHGGENVAVGRFSMSGSGTNLATNNRSSISIGNSAGYLAKTNNNGIMLGTNAGRSASGLFDCVFVGLNAGRGVFGYPGSSGLTDGRCPSLVAIGKEALLSGVDVGQLVAIGDFAGAHSSGLFHSVLIGRGAGYGRSGRNSIIVSNRSALLPNFDANWAPSGQIEVLDIGRSIQGLMGFSDSNRDVRIHIGLPLESGTYRDHELLDFSALNLTPSAANRSAVVLYANPTGQSVALMRTEVAPIGGVISARINDVVNKDGMLRLPIATGVSGSDILSEMGIIPTGQGVVAGWKVGSERGVAICIDGAWHKISGVPI